MFWSGSGPKLLLWFWLGTVLDRNFESSCRVGLDFLGLITSVGLLSNTFEYARNAKLKIKFKDQLKDWKMDWMTWSTLSPLRCFPSSVNWFWWKFQITGCCSLLDDYLTAWKVILVVDSANPRKWPLSWARPHWNCGPSVSMNVLDKHVYTHADTLLTHTNFYLISTPGLLSYHHTCAVIILLYVIFCYVIHLLCGPIYCLSLYFCHVVTPMKNERNQDFPL